MPDSVVAFLGIGSNLGDPVLNCRVALGWLDQRTTVLRRSSLYRSEPVGFRDQQWFVNCVLEIRTDLAPHGLLDIVQGIEEKMGRVRKERWGPRTIDIDILFYGQLVVNDDDLRIPHPELHKRRFVLAPLEEIAPYWVHPVFGISVKGLLGRLQDFSAVERIESGNRPLEPKR